MAKRAATSNWAASIKRLNSDQCEASDRTFERFAELSCLKQASPVPSSADGQVSEATYQGRGDQIEAALAPVAGELLGLIVDDQVAIEEQEAGHGEQENSPV